MALSSVGLEDEAIIVPLSLRKLIPQAHSNKSARKVLGHIVANRRRTRPYRYSERQFETLPEGSPHAENFCVLHRTCQDCYEIFSATKLLHGSRHGYVKREERWFLHKQTESLYAAVGNGCHFCTLVLEAHRDPSPVPEDCVYVQIVKRHRCELELYVTVAPRLGLYKGLLPAYSGIKFETSTSPGWFKGHGTVEPWHSQWYNFTGSPDHIELAQNWISECVDTHEVCQVRKTKRLLPTRLIRIQEESNGNIQLCLHETSSEDDDKPYLALSHCWGGATDILILNSSNIDNLKSHIDNDALSKSFQDALKVTLDLGFEYLWIDCLCIVQDSREDWLRESSRMGDIYERATCVIMSAAARDPHGGLFQHRNPLQYAPFRIAGSPSNGLYVMPNSDKGKIEEVLIGSPLQSRAWTFQESYLSRRRLYFGPYGIYWSCRCGIATECVPNGKSKDSTEKEISTIFGPAYTEKLKAPVVPPTMLGDDHAIIVKRGTCPIGVPYKPDEGEVTIPGNISLALGKPPREHPTVVDNVEHWAKKRREGHEGFAHFHEDWFEVVAAYSGRSLTKAGDKLIALSGIASRIKHDTGYQYLAGLWRETLLLNLCWHIDPHDDKGPLERRSTEYIAPTWSWASVRGRATSNFLQPDLASVSLAEVTSATVSTRDFDEDAVVSVSHGIITITGMLTRITKTDFSAHESAGTSHRRADVYHGDERLGWVDYDVELPPSDIFIAPLVEDIDWARPRPPNIRGLALVNKGTHFERIGAFEASFWSDSGAAYKSLRHGQCIEYEIR